MVDFAKAFDRVSHNKLVNKLVSLFDFSATAAKLIRSYLEDRYQAVFCNEVLSSFELISSGVPQGSVLGPLLFSLFINDLPANLDYCSIHLFADDVQIYFCNNSNFDLNDVARKINHDLGKLSTWSNINLLAINPSKTKAVLFAKNNNNITPPQLFQQDEPIQFFDRVTNLGVIITSQLKWEAHINVQCGKIYGTLKQLNLATKHFHTSTKLKLFKSLLLPHFVYGDSLFANTSVGLLNKFRRALNACVRYVYNLSRFSHVSHLHKSLLGCTFSDFYKYRSCLSIFKINHSKTPEYLFSILQPLGNLRTRNLSVPRHSTRDYSSSLFVRGIVHWNSLPTSIKASSNTRVFKRQLLAWLNSTH